MFKRFRLYITGITFLILIGSAVIAHADSIDKGEITVTSLPSGATFEITGMTGMRWTGTTPSTLNNMPQMEYKVHFGKMEGCILPQPQRGAIRTNVTKIKFSGIYICEESNASSANSSSSATSEPKQIINQTVPTPERSEIINIRLWNTFNQTEGLPGTQVMMTVGIRNLGNSTLRDLSVSESFDENKIIIPRNIPENGSLVQNGVVAWNIPHIYAGQSWTAVFPVSLNNELKTGEQVQAVARVSGQNIVAGRDELLSKTATIGIATMPATGDETEKIIFALFICATAITFAYITRRKKHVMTTA